MARACARGVIATVVVAVLTSCNAFENEGRADEAEAKVRAYVAGLAGGTEDRGWWHLSESMRQALGSGEDYAARLHAAEGDLELVDVALIYEDDGLYDFAVSTREPVAEPYQAVLFGPAGPFSQIACRLDDTTFEIAVIIAPPLTPHGGISGKGCKR